MINLHWHLPNWIEKKLIKTYHKTTVSLIKGKKAVAGVDRVTTVIQSTKCDLVILIVKKFFIEFMINKFNDNYLLLYTTKVFYIFCS